MRAHCGYPGKKELAEAKSGPLGFATREGPLHSLLCLARIGSSLARGTQRVPMWGRSCPKSQGGVA